MSVFMQAANYNDAFPELHRRYVIVLDIRVLSASCENSFSSLSLVLIQLYSTMVHERMKNLGLMRRKGYCKINIYYLV